MKAILKRVGGLGVAGLALWGGCARQAPAPGAKVPTVVVSRPSRELVSDFLELTGTAAASRSVDLVARVTGYLRSIQFEDGALVQEGQLLFVIEPDPYEQQLRLAQASLLRAQSEYDRQLELSKENATSAATVERWLSERDQASAQVELAKLNLGYTRVCAPFRGRMGRHLVDAGNLVGPAVNSRLASLEQLSPIYVYFNLNERDVLHIRDWMRRRGQDPLASVGRTPVLVGVQDSLDYPYEGTLDFLDTGISTATGTLQMRASLANERRSLFPGVFARVRIPLGAPQPLLVLPEAALGNDQEGDYVLVVDAEDRVVRHSIVRGPRTATGCAIASGLSAEDRVIVRGLMQAEPGSRVSPESESRTSGAGH